MKIVKRTFKPIDKEKMYSYMLYLSWATIVFCLILKLLGSRQFETPEFTHNINPWIRRLINLITYEFNSIMCTMILIKRKPKVKETLLTLLLGIVPFGMSLFTITVKYKIIIEVINTILIGLMFMYEKWYKVIIESIIIHIYIGTYQIISMSYKLINIDFIDNNFIVELILMIDYYILLTLTVLRNIKKGGLIYDRWRRFLVVLSNKRRNEKCLPKNQSVIHRESIEDEAGFKIFTVILSVFQFVLVGTLCYFINKTTWQYIIIFVSFVFMRICFGNSYHCKKVIYCTTLACVLYVSITKLSLPLYVSTLCNVLLGTVLAYMMYVMYYFYKYTNAQGITIQVGMSEELFNQAIDKTLVSEVDYRILKDFYVNKKSILHIANKYGFSTESVKKHKAFALKSLDL